MAILKIRTKHNPKKRIILFLFLLFSITCYSQQTERYEIEMKEFFSFVRNTIFKDQDTLRIANYLTNKRPSAACVRCLSLPFEKEGFFTESEAQTLYKKIDDTTKYPIPVNFIERAIMVDDKGAYLSNIHYLSKPIFFRNNCYCIFSYAIPFATAFSVDGYNQIYRTVLCKKEKGEWRIMKTLALQRPID